MGAVRMLPMFGCDPGHGGRNTGARVKTPDGTTVLEKRINWRIARAVRQRQPNLILTRDGDDTTEEFYERARRLRRALVECVVSVHCDFAPWAPDVHGLHAYHRRADVLGRKLARFAVDHAPEPLQHGRNGVICAEDNPRMDNDDWKRRAQRIVECYRPAATVLLECGYMSNADDLAYLTSAEGVDAIADTIAATYEQYRHLTQGI